MRRTKTRIIEETIINMYYCSIKKEKNYESEKASFTISIIREVFMIISKFTKDNHAKIVEQIYFSKENIISLGVERIAEKLFLHRNTLYGYRKKYCKVIDTILDFIDINNIFNYYYTA